MIDFAALPPEINSARMYSGPGSGPMLAAAAAWNTMAAEMRSTAAAYGAVISELTSSSWAGPSSVSMAAAAAPYLAWLSGTAGQAEQAGAQANAAATAYESAFAMTVPPVAIATNRAQLAMLVATNIFGQNTPAIAATEAQYSEMWAQDAAAMYGYANASSAATRLTPLTSPQSMTDDEGVANQAGAVARAVQTTPGTVSSSVSSAASQGVIGNLADLVTVGSPASATGLSSLLSGSNGSALGTFLSGNFFSTAVTNGALAGGPFNPQFILGSIAGFSFLNDAAKTGGLLPGLGDVAGAGSGFQATAAFTGATALGPGMGHAQLVGSLSVPPQWASAATISPATTALPANGLSDIGSSPVGGPGGIAAPMAGVGGRLRRAVPKYGFRPVVIPRPPAAG